MAAKSHTVRETRITHYGMAVASLIVAISPLVNMFGCWRIIMASRKALVIRHTDGYNMWGRLSAARHITLMAPYCSHMSVGVGVGCYCHTFGLTLARRGHGKDTVGC